ncbi:2-dehydro-3-deoxy-6-phosphogalactonate aldolase [Pseudocitrobacter cyperus]|uniref:2-dehydro-3-deoxy-6-phosphogalactonate aldolase n=1 Tax=Pseudocitrobacter cyperus TaxID=3112843 RepID=A0ABV0HPN5_9ENTR
MDLNACIKEHGLIAILRGIHPREAEEIGLTLYEEGFRIIEVPLNSPSPCDSIRALRQALPQDCLIGAGTVLTAQQAAAVKQAGGQLIVMPHSDPAVIDAAKAAGLFCAPGVATLTEAFAAVARGADAIKIFPAEQITPAIVRAWRAVFPRHIPLLPVGGITPEGMADYLAVGANGFGLGGALYKPGNSASDVRQAARQFMQAWRQCQP